MSAQQREPTAPPPERGRYRRPLAAVLDVKNADAKHRLWSEARRVGVKGLARFNRDAVKTMHARRLRHESTNVEMRLWQRLRNKQLGVDFRRQHPVGRYVLDFYCPVLRLAIELDGGQHNLDANGRRDQQQDHWFSARGVTMLRFWNSDVTGNMAGVLETIAAKLSELHSSGMTPTRRWRADLPLSGGG